MQDRMRIERRGWRGNRRKMRERRKMRKKESHVCRIHPEVELVESCRVTSAREEMLNGVFGCPTFRTI